MFAALTLLATVAAPHYDVAMAARFYYPPGDRRISRNQIYVSDLHGKTRKQITAGGTDAYSVRWAGPDHLVWLEDRNDRTLLRAASLSTLKPQTIGSYKEVEDWVEDPLAENPLNYARGQAVYKLDGRLVQISFSGTGSGKHQTSFSEPVKHKRSVERTGPEHYGYTAPGAGKVVVNPEHLDVEVGPDEAVWLFLKDRKISFKSEGVFVDFAGGNDSEAFVHTLAAAVSAGSNEYIYRVDWKRSNAKPIISDVWQLDFDYRSPYWSANQGGRSLSRLGSKEVWTAEGLVGNWRTGRTWRVAKGIVLTGNIALRPGLQ